ncbi:BatA domain-containing protein [Hymenobacter psychrotolerans]|uniref:N-terminal double-transmembrane domain-containing protein n=1 Tax=Hymenobacter psychrotolerans DSM 18569 TaxID=1121959 RepID=A0A1M6PK46_9BACT|nr:BatA domain-containing protein [Hymenobacter psychrotolerans]SHK08295.1 N-terminal double-transmembrane domain-containing protein [Hymenobacter psychrotolerans DSM 18569]
MPTVFFSAATAGWLALLGLAVPVAIHLWNRRPGRVVRVGSVRWLEAAANRRLRNLRLEQVGLLLLRAALVALLALAVAGPVWQRPQPARPVRGLVLLAPETLHPEVLPALRPAIDSLRRQGYALRLFAPGFRPVSAQAWSQPDSLSQLRALLPADSLPADDYWTRARQAADSFPVQPLRVFSGTGLAHFGGARPALPARLTWQAVPLPDSARWLTQAYQPHPDTLRLLIGHSQEEATTFRTVQVLRPRQAGALRVAGLPGLAYQPGPRPLLRQPGRPAVPIQTSPVRVVLYADAAHASSGRYLRAALRAAALGLHRPLELRTVAATDSLPSRPDWLFWLSSQPAPPAWQARARRGGHLWEEAAQGTPVQARLALTGLAEAGSAIELLQLDTSRAPARATPVWPAGTGQPMLLREAFGQGSRYQLRTRLHPAWTSLPETPVFPTLLLQVLRTESEPPPATAPHDLRRLDSRQLGAAAVPAGPAHQPPATIQPAPQQLALRRWAVLAALLLFALERWVARRISASPSSAATA